MANTLLTVADITNESLMVLENELTFAAGVNRDYDDRFAIEGAKIGDTANVRRPPRFVGTSGPNLSVEAFYSSSVPVKLGDTANYGDQFHVDVSFTTKDLRLSLGGFSETVIKPAVAAIANKIDYVGLTMAKNYTANIVGTYGTAPSALLTFLQAAAYLDSEAAPRDGRRTIVVEPFTSAAIVDSLKGLFMPSSQVSERFKKGLMGRDSGGMDWLLDQNVNVQTTGAWAASSASTLTADTTSIGISSGWAQTTTFTLTFGATLTLKAGDVISIANVFPVNPQNRQRYGGTTTKKFVVTSDFSGTGSSTGSVTVSPAIITAGQFQNCSIPTTSGTATVTPYSIGVSAVGNASPQNVLYHRNAYTLAMADLEMPAGVHFAGRASDKEAGLSIRIVRQYTINNDQIPCRFDSLWGWAPIYGELGCRVAA